MGIGLSLDIVRKSSQDSQHSQDSQQQKSKREEKRKESQAQHELIEEIPEDTVASQTESEGEQRPRPQRCKQAPRVNRELCAPPGERHLYPCPDHTSDDAKNGGDEASTNKELDD